MMRSMKRSALGKLTLTGAALGILTLSSGASASEVGQVTVGEFRAMALAYRVFMVSGAIEVLASVGKVECPYQTTVGEWEAALMYQPLKESENWVIGLLKVMTQRGCTSKAGVNPNA